MKLIYDRRANLKSGNLPQIPNGSFPIMWFGNYQRLLSSELRIVTVGKNPSSHEFKSDNTGTGFLRFPGLTLSNWTNWTNYEQGMNEYFSNQFYQWFYPFENVLNVFSATYGGKMPNQAQYHNRAVHIDYYSDLATCDSWTNLSASEQLSLTYSHLPIFFSMLSLLNPSVVLTANDKECVENLAAFMQVTYAYSVSFNGKIAADVYQSDGKLLIQYHHLLNGIGRFSNQEMQEVTSTILDIWKTKKTVANANLQLPVSPVTASVPPAKVPYKYKPLRDAIERIANKYGVKNLADMKALFPDEIIAVSGKGKFVEECKGEIGYQEDQIVVNGKVYWVITYADPWNCVSHREKLLEHIKDNIGNLFDMQDFSDIWNVFDSIPAIIDK